MPDDRAVAPSINFVGWMKPGLVGGVKSPSMTGNWIKKSTIKTNRNITKLGTSWEQMPKLKREREKKDCIMKFTKSVFSKIIMNCSRNS